MRLDDARSALSGTTYADLRWSETTGSTNADLADAARRGDDPCALVADFQTAGRGRLDRRWESPAGAALMMSVLVAGPFPDAGPQVVPLALALAAREAVAELCGQVVGLKWPNDLVVGSPDGVGLLKLGGLLAELVTEDLLVVGVGLNVAWPDGFPDELAATATALNLLGHDVSRWALVAETLRRFGTVVDDLASRPDAGARLMRRYGDACVTLGERVRVELPRAVLVGRAVEVTADGALVVEDDQRVRREVNVGDVVHLRPDQPPES